MNIKFLTKVGIIFGSVIIGTFFLFLLLPFFLNFFIDKYTPQIVGEINKATGLSAGIEDVKIVTTPKMTAGLKVKTLELYTNDKKPIFIGNNFEIKMSLLPLITKNIRVDVINVNNADIVLEFDKNGDLDLLKMLPQQEFNESKITDHTDKTNSGLPFGFKLSNHLPDIHIGGYKITLTDGKDKYIVNGNKTDITDFIINKSIKIKGSGNIILKEREQFTYNLNLFNKIMPDEELEELIFSSKQEEKDVQNIKINIIDILKGLYEYNVTASTNINLNISKDSTKGDIKIFNASIINLPNSNVDLLCKGNSIDINSNIYTAKNEVSSIQGKINTGKNPLIDINVKSDLDIKNVTDILKKVAIIFNIDDLKTLSANGKINADLNLKSDMKTVISNGFLQIPLAQLYYGAYKVGIDNIKADISLANNNVNIKNISFTILNQPLKIQGTLTKDAYANINLAADKLNLKGLLVAIGQASIMKENPVYSGTVSMNALIKGKLDKINPVIKLNIDNIDIKNIPADIRLSAPSTAIDITSDGKTFGGIAKSRNVKLVNPALTILLPTIDANITPDIIEITQTPVSIEKNKANISGKITNYLTEKIGLDFISTGDIKSTLKGDLNIIKQTLNLIYSTTDLSEIIIPMFDKSKLSFKGKINISGNMTNPIIKGNAFIPSVSIPEIPVTMSNMDLDFNGTILHGNGTVQNFTSGGIAAQHLSGDFALKGMDFYLNNLKGDSFGGKINGEILYNLSNANTKIIFQGSGLNAENAIEGATGIKNALTGNLNFDTNISLTVLEYNAMIKSMKGNLNFNIKDGAFGTIGRFEGFLGASNITQNYFLKNTVNALSNAAGLATTAQFDSLSGSMTFSDGWANLNPIKSAGPSLCYYITGKYHLTNGTTNVNILGRLDAPMVAKLGIIGTLNMSSIIGDKAASVLKIITSNPNEEKTELIPSLTNKSTNYQDFKVIFNGGIDSKSSIKTFKWLKNADLTDVSKQTPKDVVNNVKEAYKTDINSAKEEITNTIETEKQKINNAKEQINTTKEDFKNLWNSIKDSAKKTEIKYGSGSSTKIEQQSVNVQETVQAEKQEQTTQTNTTSQEKNTVNEIDSQEIHEE